MLYEPTGLLVLYEFWCNWKKQMADDDKYLKNEIEKNGISLVELFQLIDGISELYNLKTMG